jgi:hypothetical protein
MIKRRRTKLLGTERGVQVITNRSFCWNGLIDYFETPAWSRGRVSFRVEIETGRRVQDAYRVTQ